MGLTQIGDGGTGKAIEAAGRQNQDRGVHQKGQGQGDHRIESGKAEGPLAHLRTGAPAPGLHQRGMQIKVVGHHGGAQDPSGQIELGAVAQGIHPRHQASQHAGRVGTQQ